MRALPGFIRSSLLARLIRPYRRARLFRRLDNDDRARIDFYSQFVNKHDLVFDVGANFGNRTRAFLELGAEVVAFEPQVECADYLATALKWNRNFRLVRRAVGSKVGSATMHLSDFNVVSSLSKSWIEATTASGRFASVAWDKSAVVEVTTLDSAIAEMGKPSFVKIDVEGYESEAVSGLSHAIDCLSIEFTSEYLDAALECIDHLESLGPTEGQVSYGESLVLALPVWQRPSELKETLSHANGLVVGDLYIRSLSRS